MICKMRQHHAGAGEIAGMIQKGFIGEGKAARRSRERAIAPKATAATGVLVVAQRQPGPGDQIEVAQISARYGAGAAGRLRLL